MIFLTIRIFHGEERHTAGKLDNQNFHLNILLDIIRFFSKVRNLFNRLSPNNLSGPDGVEAWTVAFAACAINFVMAGLARMSGILYVAFIDVFQAGRKEASLPFSVRSSMRNLFGNYLCT